MDLASWISFIEQNRVGFHLEVDGVRVLDVKPNGRDVDIEIHDISRLKKLRSEVNKWRV